MKRNCDIPKTLQKNVDEMRNLLDMYNDEYHNDSGAAILNDLTKCCLKSQGKIEDNKKSHKSSLFGTFHNLVKMAEQQYKDGEISPEHFETIVEAFKEAHIQVTIR